MAPKEQTVLAPAGEAAAPALALDPNVCSNTSMLTPDDFGLSDQHYRIHGHQLSEAMPDRCPAGHVLGENTVLIGCA